MWVNMNPPLPNLKTRRIEARTETERGTGTRRGTAETETGTAMIETAEIMTEETGTEIEETGTEKEGGTEERREAETDRGSPTLKSQQMRSTF
jgi:hypothetical protein